MILLAPDRCSRQGVVKGGEPNSLDLSRGVFLGLHYQSNVSLRVTCPDLAKMPAELK